MLIRCQLLEDFVAVMSSNAHYLRANDGIVLQMRPLIYDDNYKLEEMTMQPLAWVSFPNLLPTFFERDTLFTIASAVGRPL